MGIKSPKGATNARRLGPVTTQVDRALQLGMSDVEADHLQVPAPGGISEGIFTEQS
jgi:hypothetical protein